MVELADVSKIIAGINPDKYTVKDNDFQSEDKSGFKKALKEDFWDAVKNTGKFNLKSTPSEEHKIVYESSSETLEPVYFWILDFMNGLFGGKVEKLTDNFVSSPGGGHFEEMTRRMQTMQQMATKVLADVNIVIKSIVNIIYDLKEFQIRLSYYESAASKDKHQAESGTLALKQIWMDNVDIKKGRGSINMLVQDLNFVTIRDAFMIIENESLKGPDGKEIDLNDRVKRILKPRIREFLEWKTRSEKELKKRYEIEKSYLRSQVNALKLYTRWAKPYLRAATQLEQKESGRKPSLVTAFNTMLLELTLLGKKEFNFQQSVINKKLPDSFRKIKVKRKYYSCVLVYFNFRGIPQRVGQHYLFGGRVEVTFQAYALNENELKMLDQKLEQSDIAEALNLVSGATEESLGQLQEDIDFFLKEEEKEEKKKQEDVNPFAALLGLGRKKEAKGEGKKKEENEEEIEKIKSDTYTESMARQLAEQTAKELNFNLFDIYKKAHGMASHPNPFE